MTIEHKRGVLIIFSILLLTLVFAPTLAFATKEGSYQNGLQASRPDTNSYPEFDNYTCALHNSTVIQYPPVTNTTACIDGFFVGYKDWCISHAVNCVGNMTLGYLPDVLIKKIWETHQQYQRGYNAANSVSLNVCPIGENAVFCTGWNDYNNEHNDAECGHAYDNYTGPFSNDIGCPLDIMNQNQMAKPHALVGCPDHGPKIRKRTLCNLTSWIYTTHYHKIKERMDNPNRIISMQKHSPVVGSSVEYHSPVVASSIQ